MKALVTDTDGRLNVHPFPDQRDIPTEDRARIVDVPGPLISTLQLAQVRLQQAEDAIRTHLAK